MKITPIKIINLILGVALFVSMALLVKEGMIWKYAPKGASARAHAKSLAAGTDAGFSRYEIISVSGILGRGRIALMEQLSAAGTKDNRQIALFGTVVGRSGISYAVFQDKTTKKQEVFRTGEEVFNVGTLVVVDAVSAVINANGNMLTFLLPEAEPSEAAIRREAAIGHPREGAPPLGARKSGESEWIIDQRALNGVLNDMQKVLTDARLMPYSDGGKVAGFRISEIKPNGVFNLIGLQNGDVLVKVNDYQIDSPQKGIQLLTGLKGESSLMLDIIRNGQPKKLNYIIR